MHGAALLTDFPKDLSYLMWHGESRKVGMQRYAAKMGEFHQPAEHLINGKRYPLEFQIYFNEDFVPVPVATPKPKTDEQKAADKKAAAEKKKADDAAAAKVKADCKKDKKLCPPTPPKAPEAGDWNWSAGKAAVSIMFEEKDCRINSFSDCKALLLNKKSGEYAAVFDSAEFKACEAKKVS